jgi:hypothetical protein
MSADATMAVYFPALQLVQPEAPAAAEYFPAAQSVQLLSPSLEYAPAAQAVNPTTKPTPPFVLPTYPLVSSQSAKMDAASTATKRRP